MFRLPHQIALFVILTLALPLAGTASAAAFPITPPGTPAIGGELLHQTQSTYRRQSVGEMREALRRQQIRERIARQQFREADARRQEQLRRTYGPPAKPSPRSPNCCYGATR